MPRNYVRTAPAGKKTPATKWAGKTEMIRIVERQVSWIKVQIQSWRAALQMARNIQRPRRQFLQEIYEAAFVDNHLTAIVEKRALAVAGHRFRVMVDGVVDEDLTKLLGGTAFYKFLEIILTVPAKGPVLVGFNPPLADKLPAPYTMPRRHYVPEHLAILPDLTGDEEVVVEGELFAPWFIHVGDADMFGFLWKAIPQVTFKLAAERAWAEYLDRFGEPIRKATMPAGLEEKVKRELFRQLEKMGKASFIGLPQGVDLELLQAAGRDGVDVFNLRIDRVNSELSKLVQGNTMTTDNGSSRSQSEVHQETANLFTEADKRFVAGVINDQYFPLLAHHDPRFANAEFKFAEDREISITEQLAVDTWLNDNFEIPTKHFAEKYGVPITAAKAKAGSLPVPVPPVPAAARVAAWLGLRECPGCGKAVSAEVPGKSLAELRGIVERVAAGIHGGGLPPGVIPPELLMGTGSAYEQALAEGLGADLAGVSWDDPDMVALDFLRSHAWQFADARSATIADDIRSLLVDADGKRRGWADFLREVMARNEEYYQPWLKTEYNHAQISATAASQWRRIVEEQEVWPSLRYDTVGDARVRAGHAKLDGITRPVGDAFWATAFPPNGWNCRCDAAQVDGGAALTEPGKAMQAATEGIKEPAFRKNVGVTLNPFPAQHPYLDNAGPRNAASYGLPKAGDAKAAPAKAYTRKAWQALYDKGAGDAGLILKDAGASRAMAMPKAVADTIAADPARLEAMAQVGTEMQPHEVWETAGASSNVITMLWLLDGFAARVLAIDDGKGITVSDVARLGASAAEAARRGTLTRLKGGGA
jgi:SPP1 gp7 family putative phage head morphogenesis protein